MWKSFFIFILLFVSFSIAAQKAKTESKWSATLTGAIIPLPEFNAGIQPGINYQFNKRLSLLTEITIRVGNKADKDSEAVNKKYFRVQPELRYNFYNKKRKRNDYAGLRLSYAVRKFSDINKGFYAIKRPGDDGYFYDKANINSPVITSSLQFGTVFPAGKKFSIDLFTGIGARFIKTAYTDVVNPIKGMRSRPTDGPTFYASYSYEGALTLFYLNAGLRLMYHFR